MTEVGMLLRAVRVQGKLIKPLERKISTCKVPEFRESLVAMYNRERRIFDAKLKEVQPFLDRMNEQQIAFCTAYYIHGLSLPEVSDILDRSERQCARYKTKIEKGE